ncbi:ABC transporter permease [Candidatus Giovannonibacteria bacterium]|nr:ABC transporter permease [Candidatus Giovannonibacteria bacterium]
MDRVTFGRIIKGGFVNFFRNGVVSLATVLVISLTMFMLGSVLVGGIFLNGVISNLEEKVDITAYFKLDTDERDILEVKSNLEKLPDVKGVVFVSRDEALNKFLERHKGDELYMKTIEIVGDNPFPASLEIQAVDPSRFEAISVFLESGRFQNLIDEKSPGIKNISYRLNQSVIDRLSVILRTIKLVGFGISLILALIALMVAYNTVRLAIYSSKDEISVMQLVGASRSFIRGPFLVEGVIHGVISALFTIVAFYPLLLWAGKRTAGIFGGIDIYGYYVSYIWQISFILLLVGIAIGVLSSALAMRRYLKV